LKAVDEMLEQQKRKRQALKWAKRKAKEEAERNGEDERDPARVRSFAQRWWRQHADDA
jgi:hypothetical protein